MLRQLEVLGSRIDVLVGGVARRHGLSHAALNALAVIEGAGEPLAAGEVSARMHVTTGTMTSVLDTLERNGYVRRLDDPADRRRVLVDITPAAQAVLDELLPEVQQVAKAVVGAIDDGEQAAVLDALVRIGAAVGAVPDDLPAPAPRRRPATLNRRSS